MGGGGSQISVEFKKWPCSLSMLLHCASHWIHALDSTISTLYLLQSARRELDWKGPNHFV